MTTDKRLSQFSSELDKLQSLLEKQIKLTRQGSISEVKTLSRQTSSFVEKITQAGIPESTEFEARRGKLQKLYEHLCLAVTVHKADAAKQLSRVCKGKKTIKAYRSNI
jgi:hypothetical protein